MINFKEWLEEKGVDIKRFEECYKDSRITLCNSNINTKADIEWVSCAFNWESSNYRGFNYWMDLHLNWKRFIYNKNCAIITGFDYIDISKGIVYEYILPK